MTSEKYVVVVPGDAIPVRDLDEAYDVAEAYYDPAQDTPEIRYVDGGVAKSAAELAEILERRRAQRGR